MLGWEIIIHTEFTDSTNESDWRLPKDENVLATWRTSLGGVNWLHQLVSEGKARFLGGGGYPIRFRARVKDVLPLIQDGPPSHRGSVVVGENYDTTAVWSSKATIRHELFAQHGPDTMIIIDAWDED